MTADDAGVAPEQAAVAEVLAEAMYVSMEWSGCAGSSWAQTSDAVRDRYRRHAAHVAAALAANLPADDGARAALAEVERRIISDGHPNPHTDLAIYAERHAAIVREVAATVPAPETRAGL